MKQPPFQDEQALAQPRVERVPGAGGSFVLRNPEPLQPFARCIGDWLEHWARDQARRHLPGRARRRGPMAHRHLPAGARPGRPDRPGADRRPPGAGQAGGRAVGQLGRGRPARAGRDARGPALVHGVQRLLPSDQGLHQDLRHPVHVVAGAGLRVGRPGLWPAAGGLGQQGADLLRRERARASGRAGVRPARGGQRDPRGDGRVRGDPARPPREIPA